MSSPFFTFFNFFCIIKGPLRNGVKRGALVYTISVCNHLIVSRAPWGTGVESELKYEGDSVRAVFWNCPKPYILEVYRISLDTSTAKMLGFFWCEWDYCIPTSIAKNTMFFFLPSPFRRQLRLWYSVRLTLVPTTIVLTQTLYNLFGKLLFSHLHTEPRTGNSIKNLVERELSWTIRSTSDVTKSRLSLNHYTNIRRFSYTRQVFFSLYL